MRKFLATLLALTMMVVPVCSLAASPSELMEQAVNDGLTLKSDVSFAAGSLPFDADTNTVLSDLLNAFAFTKTTSAAQNSFVMSMSGVEALSLTTQLLEDRLYVKSNLLGESVVSLSGAEVTPLLQKLVNAFGGMFGMTNEQITEVQSRIGEMEVSDIAEITAMPEGSSMFTVEELQPMIDALLKRAEKAKTENVTAQPKNSDPAATVTTLTLTGADIGGIYDVAFDILEKNTAYMAMLDQVVATTTAMQVSMNGTGKATVDTPANGQEALEQSRANVAEIVKHIDSVDVTAFVSDKDELVSANAKLNMTMDDDKAAMDFQFDRLTTSDGVGYSGTMLVLEDGEAEASMTFNLLADSTVMDVFTFDLVEPGDEGEDDVSLFSLSYVKNKDYADDAKASDDTTLTLSVRPEEDASPLLLTWKGAATAAYDGKAASRDVTGGLYLGEETQPLFSVTKTTASVEAEALLSDGTDVRPGTMEDTEFLSFVNTAMNTMMIKGLTMIQLLPRSFQQLVSGAMTK